MEPDIKKHTISLEQGGSVDVYVEGEQDKLRTSPNAFLTLHDVGSSYHRWVEFNKEEDMQDIKSRSLFIHVCLPGQEPSAEDMGEFPSLTKLSLHLVSILDHLRINMVMVLAEGAGANIALRFGIQHPGRVHGMVLVNTAAGAHKSGGILGKNEGRRGSAAGPEALLNMKNVVKYEEAYKKRSEILSQLGAKITVDTLLVAGTGAAVKEGEAMIQALAPGISSLIRLETRAPLEESPDKVAEAVSLFAQGLGLVPTARRRKSSVCSPTASSPPAGGAPRAGRRMSMEQFDVPNHLRLLNPPSAEPEATAT